MLITLPNAIGNAATNMAVDASLLQSLPKGVAVFRHYAWIEPACTFGYAQSYAEVCSVTPKDVTLCRRLTGGGIVDHRNDWTYALVLETTLPAAHRPATELYKDIHCALSEALRQQEIDSQPAPCPKLCQVEHSLVTSVPDGPSQCFVSPVANDVLDTNGHKIAGAAMKRNRHGLLIQGSIDRSQLPVNFDAARFSSDFTKRLSAQLDIPLAQLEDLRHLFNGPAIQEFREQFSGSKWNQRR